MLKGGRLRMLWLERLTGHQKVAGLIPVWGSEIVFLRIELDKRSSITHCVLYIYTTC